MLHLLSLALCFGLVATACSNGLGVATAQSARQLDEVERIVDLLELRDGSRVADIGADDGEWSVFLADHVGSLGRVLATEVTDAKVEEIERRARRAQASVVDALRGNQTTLGLPDQCCDAALIRMVYHHFQDPENMRASLVSALRPNARVLVIDTLPQKHWGDVDGELDRGGHGILVSEALIAEMTGDGFEVDRAVRSVAGTRWRSLRGALSVARTEIRLDGDAP